MVNRSEPHGAFDDISPVGLVVVRPPVYSCQRDRPDWVCCERARDTGRHAVDISGFRYGRPHRRLLDLGQGSYNQEGSPCLPPNTQLSGVVVLAAKLRSNFDDRLLRPTSTSCYASPPFLVTITDLLDRSAPTSQTASMLLLSGSSRNAA